jgi:Pectate lyase superfamily protein
MTVIPKATAQQTARYIRDQRAGGGNSSALVGQFLLDLVDSAAYLQLFDVVAFGAKGDGVTDDTAAFVAADAAAAAVGGAVYLPKGVYRVPVLALSSGVTLEGVGDQSVLLNSYVTCTGSVGAEIALTAAVAKGATSLPMPATDLAGQWLRLTSCINMQSTDAGRDQLGHEPAAMGFLAEYVQVKTGNAFTAELLGGTTWPYSDTPGSDSGSFTDSVARVTTFHEGGGIRNVKFLGKNPAQNHNVLAQFAKGLEIASVTFDANDITNQCVRFLYCLDCHVVDCTLTGKKTSVPGGSTANPLVFLSSQGCSASNTTIYNGNQGLDIDCIPNDAVYRGGPSIFCGATNCRAYDSATEGFTSHWGCYGSFFDTCSVKGSPRGVRVRDRGAHVTDCRLVGPSVTGIGILVDEAAFHDAVVQGNFVGGYLYGIQMTHSSVGYATLQSTLGCGASVIDANTIRDSGDHGIYLNVAYTAVSLCGPRITNNEINSPVTTGIQVNSYFNGTTIEGNRINGIASGGSAVRWNANIKRLHIDKNHAYNVHASGFGLRGSATLSFMTDAATFPGGEAEAQLFLGDFYTDAAVPFQSIIRDVAAFAAPKKYGYGAFTTPIGTSGPTAERQTMGFYLSGSSLRADTRDTSNAFTTHQLNIRGSGSPEGVVTAAVGSTYQRTDGAAGNSLYIKESGTGNTGWVPVTSPLSVTMFGAHPSASAAANVTAINAAIVAATAATGSLYWPEGVYSTNASLTNLHTVRHRGPGRILRGSDTFYVEPGQGQTNRLYLSTSGTAGNDGLSSSQPMSTPQVAFDALRNYGPSLEGTWRVVLAAGTWNGTVHRHQHATPSKNPVIVEGPDVGTGVPTAILDGNTGAVANDWAIRATGEGVQIDLRHLKGQNYTGSGGSPWTADYGATFFSTNLHGSGNNYADVYLQGCSTVRITGGTLASPRGAMINSCKDTTVGYSTGTTFSGNTVCGIEWSRGSQGHVDNSFFNDCAVGVELMHGGRVHLQANNFKRNTIAWRTRALGLVTESGPNFYNDGTADANTTRFVRHAYSGETDAHLWSSYSEALVAYDYNTYVHDGTTGGNATTNVVANAYQILAHEFEARPQRLRVVVTGKFVTWTGAPARIGVNIGATLIDQTSPKTSGASGAAGQPLNGSLFEYECTINAIGQDSQSMRATLRYDGGTLGNNLQSFSRAADTDANQWLHITAKLNNSSGDRVDIYSVEIYRLG